MALFGERLKELRTKRNLSQQELSEILNIGRSTLANYEQGKREPNFETLELFADYFNVDMNFLIGWEESQNTFINDDANIKYLKEIGEENLIELYKKVKEEGSLLLLTDETSKLSPEDVAQILRVLDAL